MLQLRFITLLAMKLQHLLMKNLDAGSYEINFDASQLSSGAYIYKISAGNFSDTKKMILSK